MSFDIVLKHVGGERKTVPVEYVSPNLTYLTIRWDLAGLYDLNLTVNVLTPRSAPGQPKGKAKWYKKDKPQWKAEDLSAVRKMASDYLKAKRGDSADETRAAMKRHVESMPGTNPRIGVPRGCSGRLAVDYIVHTHGKACRVHDWEGTTVYESRSAVVDVLEKAMNDIAPFPSYVGDPDTD